MTTSSGSSKKIPTTNGLINTDDYNRRYPLLSKIAYNPPLHNRQNDHLPSIDTIGLDCEADRNGKPFLWCSSRGDVWSDDEIPGCWFTRDLRGAHFVTWNLRYEAGALFRRLPRRCIEELRTDGRTEHGGFVYRAIGDKMVSIRRGKNTVTLWDAFPFYHMSLDAAAGEYLGERKMESDPELYFPWFIKRYHSHIVEYCIRDAVLAQRLMRLIIESYESFGVRPRKLYSQAYVAWQYFRKTCKYVHVKHFYDRRPEVLEYAMMAYNGGKFEVTTKGPGYYYEYDIVSAYPYEISNLVDISTARVLRSAEYIKDAVYSLILVDVFVPPEIPNPTPLQIKGVNIYPAGRINRWIHKCEYDYFVESGCNPKILDAVHIIVSRKTYPYRREIHRLMEFKDRFKREDDKSLYQLVKITMNGFYGKFVQLTDTGHGIRAGAAWNPVYGGAITAACRVRVSRLQRDFSSVVAVHTDSVISENHIDHPLGDMLGDLNFEVEGSGLILGSGIYQIGDKTRFRGFPTRTPLIDLLPSSGTTMKFIKTTAHGWREVAFRKLDRGKINYFHELEKGQKLNFDSKRIWLDDWTDYSEVMRRNVYSVPRIIEF